jgi:hypothetical protein
LEAENKSNSKDTQVENLPTEVASQLFTKEEIEKTEEFCIIMDKRGSEDGLSFSH